MKILTLLKNFSDRLFVPIKANLTLFVFMYFLGVMSAWITTPPKASLYANLYLELFVDMYITCLALMIIPRKIRFWFRQIIYVILYLTALADVYCYVNFDSTLNPSMLLLVGETNSREAGEFISSLVSPDIIFSEVGFILLLLLVQIIVSLLPYIYRQAQKSTYGEYLLFVARLKDIRDQIAPYVGMASVIFLFCGLFTSLHNKVATWKLMTGSTIGEVEHTLTERDHAVLYVPITRLAFSIYANSLASQQIDQLIAATDKIKVDSCDYTSPTIVLIIGESYSRHHSQQYGYFKDTTPRQVELEKSGQLVKFTDVVTCWNLTSFVFKNMFSLHVVGQKGEWCDYPLFPELFRKAGYHVTFLTNQFLSKAKEAVYDFSGGFFLNNPTLDKAQFDTRNTELHQYDEGLLADYDNFVKEGKIQLAEKRRDTIHHNLVIFHLIGQHVTYKDRYPKDRSHFWASSYEEERPELTDRQRKVLSHYDNAIYYNDSIVNQIVKRFRKKDAVVVYVPDHGEECYEENRGFICRNHSSSIDYPLAKYEFEIPFWIYCSPKYSHRHPQIYKQIIEAKKRRFMTDALPHMLLYLGGIHAKDYHAEYNVLSPNYNENRPRILKGTTDYDKLRDQATKKK
ncbi:sulfatase-like hydrolase/transferase [Segatella bryantii]|jgi:heptose-I-phosphate ethanolaminephosphotransferase|uniref:sulfatase-like hydrolase/transferase n=1 Tax=Segatella bryantii TaxID=77095 RepID=UPI0008873ADD|nr:phosphoethanolamine transferase [Segatella bryantii]SDL45868.1 heptose-I-phosphate ethanolaminephosphotransferase [Segatella bryantii]SEA28488.1 heptose-I-phosphate ethanolaminephosphotransferase [Segatella bryantii]